MYTLLEFVLSIVAYFTAVHVISSIVDAVPGRWGWLVTVAGSTIGVVGICALGLYVLVGDWWVITYLLCFAGACLYLLYDSRNDIWHWLSNRFASGQRGSQDTYSSSN